MMEFTRAALLLLVAVWSLQMLGAWLQWRNFQQSMREASRSYADGFLGVGKARPAWGFGTMVLLVVDPQHKVRRLQAMSGMSVFARFRDLPEYAGLHVDALQAQLAQTTSARRLAQAVDGALAQIAQVARARQHAATPADAALETALKPR